jgi:hypothetical protein
MSSTGDLLRNLQAAHPAVRRLIAAHLAENDEVLPHLLMADVTRWLIAEGPEPHVLKVLEHHATVGDAQVHDVIGASFVENLLGEDAVMGWALGPRLTAELRRNGGVGAGQWRSAHLTNRCN